MLKSSDSVCFTSLLRIFATIVSLSGLLCLLRFVSNISFSEPLQLLTSGSEELSFLSLWKFVHHQPVYIDPHKIPFSLSCFNWLFYVVYGMLTKAVLFFARISDPWIPTIGRLISLFFSVLGLIIARKTLVVLCRHPSKKMNLFFLLVPFYLFFGPLTAFWHLTARPDIAAVVFELLAFYIFIKEFENRPTRAALTATLFAFIAWSFKQVNISVFLSLMIFCFIYYRRAAWMMGLMLASLCSLVVWLGGPDYRENAILFFPKSGFSNALVSKHFLYYIVQSLFAIPGYVAMGTVFFFKTFRDRILGEKKYQFCFLTAVVTSLYGGATSQKIGASENYFIPASIFAAFFCLLFLSDIVQDRIPKIFHISFYFSASINILVLLLILFGIKQHVSLRFQHKAYSELLKCTESLPRPVFSQTPYLNLPWMLGGENFVIVDQRLVGDEHKGVYERGGIRGLIREGYFATLLLDKGQMTPRSAMDIPKEDLSHYVEQLSTCPPTHLVFIRK